MKDEDCYLGAIFRIGSLKIEERFEDYSELLYLNDLDGLPVKNHLPPEIGARFKTEKQWLSLGFQLNDDAQAVHMHQSAMAMNPIPYYHESDVHEKEPFSDAEKRRYEQRQADLTERLRISTGHGGLKNNFPHNFSY